MRGHGVVGGGGVNEPGDKALGVRAAGLVAAGAVDHLHVGGADFRGGLALVVAVPVFHVAQVGHGHAGGHVGHHVDGAEDGGVAVGGGDGAGDDDLGPGGHGADLVCGGVEVALVGAVDGDGVKDVDLVVAQPKSAVVVHAQGEDDGGVVGDVSGGEGGVETREHGAGGVGHTRPVVERAPGLLGELAGMLLGAARQPAALVG